MYNVVRLCPTCRHVCEAAVEHFHSRVGDSCGAQDVVACWRNKVEGVRLWSYGDMRERRKKKPKSEWLTFSAARHGALKGARDGLPGLLLGWSWFQRGGADLWSSRRWNLDDKQGADLINWKEEVQTKRNKKGSACDIFKTQFCSHR